MLFQGRLTRDYQAVSLEITEFRNTTSPPEPNFFVKFILGPEPDGRIRRKKLHTPHRSPQNRFFENLNKSVKRKIRYHVGNLPGNLTRDSQVVSLEIPEFLA